MANNNKPYSLKVFGKTYEVYVKRSRYYSNNTLAVFLEDENGDPFATLTVNISDNIFDASNLAYVDTNNCPFAEQFIIENKLGKATGEFGFSGYCTYPLYAFDIEKIPEIQD